MESNVAVDSKPTEVYILHMQNTLRELMDQGFLDKLKALQYFIWLINQDKGFHDEVKTFGDDIALVHSEISEALEEFRNNKPITEVYYVKDKDDRDKPEGVFVELMDAFIRILDIAEAHNIENVFEILLIKELYNITRSYRHGDKKI